MARHTFNFVGGEELTTMGASWFVSYCYYCNINKAHFKWNRVSTYTNRISVYKRTLRYHKLWLTKILDMEDSRLNQNTLELNSAEIKKMTKELLKIL